MAGMKKGEIEALSQRELSAILVSVEKLDAATKKRMTASIVDPHVESMVHDYYAIQGIRVAMNNRAKAFAKAGHPSEFHRWMLTQLKVLEAQLQYAMDKWSKSTPLGKALREVHGIGPVLAAGLLAMIDIRKAPTAGSIWRFAGLDPTAKWEKGKKRPHNADLKKLCFLIGESFIKFSNNPKSEYGNVYREIKDRLVERNENQEFRETAVSIANSRNFRSEEAKAAYMSGKLIPAHIHARARRATVKLFLSDFHAAAYWYVLKRLPPKPYAIDILGHGHLWVGSIVPGPVAEAWTRPCR